MNKLIEKYLDNKHSVTIKDKSERTIYYQDGSGYWMEREYNNDGLETHYRTSNGNWYKKEYNECGQQTYFVNSDGDWGKSEYDSNGAEVFYENSFGLGGFDNRPKQMVPEEIVAQLKSLDQKQVIELIHLVIEQCHN
jgi:hypothetical protein